MTDELARIRWGSAVSAYQVEGATRAGGRVESIWDTFARRPGATTRGDTGEVACRAYEDPGAMLDAVCVAGRLDPRTMGARLESWTRDNAFEIVEHQPQKDISREESWQMRKDGRLFAAAFMHAAGEGEPGSACRVIGFDVDPAGMRDHIAARYGLPQARESEDAALLAAWAGEMEGYAGAMTIEIRKTGPVVDVWFRQ